jgi:hypothetical protein
MNRARVSELLAALMVLSGVIASSNAFADDFITRIVDCDQRGNVQQLLDNDWPSLVRQ